MSSSAAPAPTMIVAISKIESVTVYESNAQVHRVAPVSDVAPGDVVVQFKDLPKNLNRDSLQVALRDPATALAAAGAKEASSSPVDLVNLSGITFDTIREPRKEAAGETSERAEARKKADLLKIEIEALRDELTVINGELQFRTNCFDRAAGRFEKDDDKILSDVGTWGTMIDRTMRFREENLKRRRDLEDRIESLSEEVSTLEKSAGAAVTTHETFNVVRVHLHVGCAVPLMEVQLSYMVDNATWEAAYDLRFDSVSGAVVLAYNALIKQQTMESWANVTLQLSTARAALRGNPPELSPWYAHLTALPAGGARTAYDASATGASAPGAAGGSAAGGEGHGDVPLPTEASGVEAGATAVSFSIPGTHSLDNDNQPLRVTLVNVPVKADISYLTRPKQLDSAFAQLKATNMSKYTLIQGTATVFVDYQYIAKTRMERVAPRGTFKMSLGIDGGIVVKHKNISTVRSEEGGGLFAKKDKTTTKTITTVKNCKSAPILVAIEQQVPVSNDSSIVVDVLEPKYEKDTEQLKLTAEGFLIITLKLLPMQEVELPLVFSVTWPHGETVEGL